MNTPKFVRSRHHFCRGVYILPIAGWVRSLKAFYLTYLNLGDGDQ